MEDVNINTNMDIYNFTWVVFNIYQGLDIEIIPHSPFIVCTR